MSGNRAIVHFVSGVMLVLNAKYVGIDDIDDYDAIVDRAFKVIETLTDEVRNTVVSMLAERVDDIDNVDIKARLLRFIQDHKISDTEDITL